MKWVKETVYYAAVCDNIKTDAQFTARKVKALLGNDRVEVKCFTQPEELLSLINGDGYRPDIAILDIQMNSDMDGIALADRLNRLVPECEVIFLTGFAGYCSDVYRVKHVFFMDKSKVDQYLPEALEKAVDRLKTRNADPALLHFSVNGTSYNVPADAVLYLERRARKTVVATQEKQYVISSSPALLLEKAEGVQFIQCHQSFWVNCRYISGMNSQEIQLRNGEIIPISRSKAQSAKAAYFSSLGRH